MSAYDRALKMLAGRELSAARLRTRLAAHYPAEDVDEALRRLQEEGAVDDRRAARRYAETAVRTRGRGRFRVEQELAALGIDRAVAREALDEVFEDIDEQALIARALRRRLHGRTLEAADRPRLSAALQRLGFSMKGIAAALGSRAEPAEAIEITEQTEGEHGDRGETEGNGDPMS
jgi:SOS response regulatory protein OraA/RecX